MPCEQSLKLFVLTFKSILLALIFLKCLNTRKVERCVLLCKLVIVTVFYMLKISVSVLVKYWYQYQHYCPFIYLVSNQYKIYCITHHYYC